MKRRVYSVRDLKRGYLPLMFDDNDATAVRNFEFALANSNDILGFKPSDFELVYLGDFDDATAHFDALPIPVIVYTGLNFNIVKGASDAES